MIRRVAHFGRNPHFLYPCCQRGLCLGICNAQKNCYLCGGLVVQRIEREIPNFQMGVRFPPGLLSGRFCAFFCHNIYIVRTKSVTVVFIYLNNQ